MKRAHRKAHALIWVGLPIVLAAILIVAVQIHGTGL